MRVHIAAVGLAHPFEIGYENAGTLLTQTVEALCSVNVSCHNVGVVLHDLQSVQKAAV